MQACLAGLAILLPALAQTREAVIPKDEISTHRVLRGNMPLRYAVAGSISSLKLRTVAVNLPVEVVDAIRAQKVIRAGQKASIQVKPPQVLAGIVTRIAGHDAEIAIEALLPPGVAIGTKVAAMIEVGELSDVVYYERPATARGNSEAFQFVLEPDGEYARRVRVRYGRLAGSLIEIVIGLSPGDRVIVTDTSKWEAFERVRLK